MIIESHAHYSHKRFDGAFRYLTGELTAREGQREDLLDRLLESGVVLSIEPAIDFESNRRTAALYRQHPDFIRLAVGVHPTRTHQAPWRQRRQLEVWAREPGVAAIGETGLDYHLPRKHRLTQLLWFRYQLGLARRLGLPLVLHIRMADRDALAMLRRRRRQLPGGVVHCFQGDWDTARAYLDPSCTEFTDGMLTEAIAAVLKYTQYAVKGCPAAREKLHNAAALAGASYGNIVDEVTPRLPYFPTEQEVSINDNDLRCAELAERLGFDDCRAMFTACQAL